MDKLPTTEHGGEEEPSESMSDTSHGKPSRKRTGRGSKPISRANLILMLQQTCHDCHDAGITVMAGNTANGLAMLWPGLVMDEHGNYHERHGNHG